MVKKIKLNINFGNKTFYTIIAIALVLIVAGIVYAYDISYSGAVSGSKASVMGHTADEIDGGSGGGAGWTHSGAQVFSGISPTTWTNMDLSSYVGAKRALIFLKIKGGTNSNAYYFRTKGDIEEVGYSEGYYTGFGGGTTVTQITQDRISYLLVETDNSGIIDWKSYGAYASTNIWLEGYIAS